MPEPYDFKKYINETNHTLAAKYGVSLSTFKKNEVCMMTGVVDHSPTFLQYLAKTELTLGSTIKINDINDFDRSLQITAGKAKPFFISNEVAKNILVSLK